MCDPQYPLFYSASQCLRSVNLKTAVVSLFFGPPDTQFHKITIKTFRNEHMIVQCIVIVTGQFQAS